MTMTGNCALNGNAKAWREQGTDGCGNKSWILDPWIHGDR